MYFITNDNPYGRSLMSGRTTNVKFNMPILYVIEYDFMYINQFYNYIVI